jgi:hypothetical protein
MTVGSDQRFIREFTLVLNISAYTRYISHFKKAVNTGFFQRVRPHW